MDIEGEINGKFIFIMKVLCKQVQNHRGRGQEHKRSEADLQRPIRGQNIWPRPMRGLCCFWR